MPIRAEYDPEADALYVRLAEGDVTRTIEHDHASAVDFDTEGNILGVEVLSPHRNHHRLSILAARFGFLERLAEAQAAVAAEVPAPATAVGEQHRMGLIFSSIGYISGATAAEATFAGGTVTTGKQSREQDLELA
jgi:uncharacterized protein YuzE